jgi:hypothetical protein
MNMENPSMAQQPQPKTSWADIFNNGFKVLGFLAIGLNFYGYGVVTAYQDLFQVPRALFFSSPLDLLWHGIDTLLFLGDRITSVDLLDPFAAKNWRDDILFLALLGCLVTLSWLAVVWAKRQGWSGKTPKQILAAVLPSRAAVENESLGWVIVRGVGYGLATFLLFFILRILGAMFLVVVMAVSVIPVLMGYAVGSGYARTQVIEPESCVSVLSREQHLALKNRPTKTAESQAAPAERPAQATCLKVIYTENEKKKTVVGRYLASSSEYLFVYDVHSHLKRLPMKAELLEPERSGPL